MLFVRGLLILLRVGRGFIGLLMAGAVLHIFVLATSFLLVVAFGDESGFMLHPDPKPKENLLTFAWTCALYGGLRIVINSGYVRLLRHDGSKLKSDWAL